MRAHGKHRCLVASLVFTTLLGLSLAQNAPPPAKPASEATAGSGDSLAAVVRRGKAQQNAHATRVFTDDDLQASAGPLPRLKMTGAENGEEVVAAIAQYKQTHTPEQTENVVRLWYQETDEDLATAIKGNLDIKAVREFNMNNGYELCQQSHDYEQCERRRRAEFNGARHDESEIQQNNERIVRIQHSLMNIRNRLVQIGLHYEWLKVRTTNNVDRF
jgi:hypothetical protein